MKVKEKVFMVDGSPVTVHEGESFEVKFHGNYGSVTLGLYRNWDSNKFSTKAIKDFQKLSEIFYDLAEKAHDANAAKEAND